MRQVKPLKKTAARLRFATKIESMLQKLFTVSATRNFTDALFYPHLFCITMPMNALLLLRMVHPKITKFYDIHIQIGYENTVVLHQVRFPRYNTAIMFPLTSEYLNIESEDITQFDNLFTGGVPKLLE